MAGLRFSVADLEGEIQAMKRLGEGFFDSSGEWVLSAFLSDLQSIGRCLDGRSFPLQLRPLKTRASRGEYEADGRGGSQEVHAVISGTWELRALGRQGICVPRC